MSIKFTCSCGKRLRARDGMARRRSFCPRCGQPVGIPALEPTHPGIAAAPLTPAQRVRLAGQRRAEAPAETATVEPPQPKKAGRTPSAAALRERVAPMLLALVTGRRRNSEKRRDRPLETHWYQCLLYPFLDWRLWVGPALLLSALGVAVVLLAPYYLVEQPEGTTALWMLRCAALFPILCIGFACNFLGCVLRSAAHGDVSADQWPGHTVLGALKAGLTWLVCFLAGPAIFAAVAAVYWMQCGDPTLVDWLILAELALVAVGYLLSALAAFSERGRWRDINAIHVIDVAHRLHYRAAVVTLVGSVLAVAHGALAVFAAEEMHRTAIVGILLFMACCLSGMFWAAFLFRLLGLWCYWSRVVDSSIPLTAHAAERSKRPSDSCETSGARPLTPLRCVRGSERPRFFPNTVTENRPCPNVVSTKAILWNSNWGRAPSSGRSRKTMGRLGSRAGTSTW